MIVRKTVFVLITVIAPELLPFNAFNEWFRARLLQKSWSATLGKQVTLKQIHYLLSGDMQISISTEEHNQALEIELLMFIEHERLAPSHGN